MKPKYKVGDLVHAFGYDSIPIKVLAIKTNYTSYKLKLDNCNVWVYENEIEDK
jgi:hypothetical protein